MNKLKSILAIALGCLMLSACETPIDVELPDYEPKLVVEGTIENGQPAVVTLTNSIPYFADINLEYVMQNVLVTDAEVTVTASDGESEQLQFQYCPDAPLSVAFVSRRLRGKENTSYTLTVKYKGDTYTAVTSIPHTFDLDSLWFDCPSDMVNADSMRSIRVLMTDNAQEANYYSFKVKVSCPRFTDRLWCSTLPLAFDDKTFNGMTFNYELERYGVSTLTAGSMSEREYQEYTRLTFRPGDTVYVKHSLIDYNTYRFMMTGGTEAIMGSNPFTNPAPVASNIQGKGVLGAWCGYASKVDTLVW